MRTGPDPELPEMPLSPSFNSYSNCNLAEIAARVVEEFRAENNYEAFYDDICMGIKENSSKVKREEKGEEEAESKSVEKEDEEEEFEFVFAPKATEVSSLISADEIFNDGQIRTFFPLFNRDLLLGNVEFENRNSVSAPKIRVPLRKLFIEERGTTSSISSSKTDDLDNLPPDMYCVWKPKAAAVAERQCKCKKSSSIGSSTWGKFRDLLYRSNSDGRKDTFFTPNNGGRKQDNGKTERPGKRR